MDTEFSLKGYNYQKPDLEMLSNDIGKKIRTTNFRLAKQPRPNARTNWHTHPKDKY